MLSIYNLKMKTFLPRRRKLSIMAMYAFLLLISIKYARRVYDNLVESATIVQTATQPTESSKNKRCSKRCSEANCHMVI